MKWKLTEDELPKCEKLKSRRCIAQIYVEKGTSSWKGYVDVYFRPDQGWFRCEDNSRDFDVLNWIYLEEFEGLKE